MVADFDLYDEIRKTEVGLLEVPNSFKEGVDPHILATWKSLAVTLHIFPAIYCSKGSRGVFWKPEINDLGLDFKNHYWTSLIGGRWVLTQFGGYDDNYDTKTEVSDDDGVVGKSRCPSDWEYGDEDHGTDRQDERCNNDVPDAQHPPLNLARAPIHREAYYTYSHFENPELVTVPAFMGVLPYNTRDPKTD